MRSVIEMAREAGAMQLMSPTKHENLGLMGNEVIERFAALVREDEREKQQEPLYFGLTPDHTWLSTTEAEYNKLKEKYRMKVYTTPPTAQQEPVAWIALGEDGSKLMHFEHERPCNGGDWQPLYTTPPTAALAARQMRDAALSVCLDVGQKYGFEGIAEAIAALPIE